MLRLATILGALAWGTILITGALADTGPSTSIAVLPWYQAAKPFILVVFATTFPVLFGWLCYQFQIRTGIKVSAQAQAQFQQAAINGAGRVLAAQEGNIANLKFDVKSAVIADEATKVAALIPDTLKQIGVTPEAAGAVLANAIAGKVGQLQAAATIPAAPVVITTGIGGQA
jgi:hypothetical protein